MIVNSNGCKISLLILLSAVMLSFDWVALQALIRNSKPFAALEESSTKALISYPSQEVDNFSYEP